MNRFLRIAISILIAFVCTVTAFCLNVDCYNENSTNSEKNFPKLAMIICNCPKIILIYT